MTDQLAEWKASYDRVIAAPDFDCEAATALVSEIQKFAPDPILMDAAMQALSNLRLACTSQSGQVIRVEAESRFRQVGPILEFLSKPRFGKRNEITQSQSFEDSCRALLGLPFGRRLFGPEINLAYKREAKLAHPDAGGNPQDFLALTQARDALLKAI